MTEAEWLGTGNAAWALQQLDRAPQHRKGRLVWCALVRLVWDALTDPRSRRAVEVAEAFADGAAGEYERMVAEEDGRGGGGGRAAGAPPPAGTSWRSPRK